MAKAATKWLPLFRTYISHLRITSKHAAEDPDGDGIPLKLWTSQTRVLEEICDGLENGIHTFYVLKSRQLGVTTVTLAILLFWLALHPNTIACQVSESDKSSVKNRATISAYLASLEAFMGKSFGVIKNNKYGITFRNKSRLDFLVAGKSKTNWGEGEGYLAGVLTEVAAYGREEGIDSFRHATAPENPRALYIYEGTAKGPNHWKDMWEAALQDEYTSRCIFVGWWSHDLQRIKATDRRFVSFGIEQPTPLEHDYIVAVRHQYGYEVDREQLAWYRWQATLPNSNIADLDQNQAWTAQQCFVQSGISFFQTRLLAKRRDEIQDAPANTSIEDGGFGYKAYNFYLGDDYHLSKVEEIISFIPPEQRKLRIWEKPHPEGWYSIGVDPAFGRNDVGDLHAIEVWRCFADRMVQVAEWADNVPDTRHCAWVMAFLAGQYQNCRLNVDLTGGPGAAVMQAFQDLRDRMRSELYAGKVEVFEDFLAAANWYLYRRIDSPGPGYMYNTKVGRDLKFRMMNMLRDSWVTNLLEIRSIPLLDEMANVRQANSDIAAEIGPSGTGKSRDDRTFALALAHLTWAENLRPGLIAQGITWEGTKAKEKGEISPLADRLNRRVYSLMKAADEAMDLPPPRTFFEQRGLN